jgi:hypothetical protein
VCFVHTMTKKLSVSLCVFRHAEIDIYLWVEIGFEFNGLYWHSNKFKEKNYHLNKTDWFKENKYIYGKMIGY